MKSVKSRVSKRASKKDAKGAAQAAASEASDSHAALGLRLRALRLSRSMTLEELANEIELTKGYISKLETGRSVPPIATLARIAKALKTDISSLLEDPYESSLGLERSVIMVRADERRNVVRGGTSFGYDYEALAHSVAHKLMDPFVFSFPSRMLKEVYFEHDAEEMIFVLSGVVDFEVGEEHYELSPGDCLYFDARLKHRGRGKHGEAKALVVICERRPHRAVR